MESVQSTRIVVKPPHSSPLAAAMKASIPFYAYKWILLRGNTIKNWPRVPKTSLTRPKYFLQQCRKERRPFYLGFSWGVPVGCMLMCPALHVLGLPPDDPPV